MFDPRTTHHPTTDSFQLYNETGHKTYQDTWEATNNSGLLMWPSKPAHQFGTTEQPCFSPDSRTEAIERGQRELMEMVRDMPESNYELSLKDLVEYHHRVENTEEEERNKGDGGRGGGRKVKRNGNIIDRGGFYLKVVFPFPFGSKIKNNKKNKNKKKNESSSGNSSSKVSPRPSASDGSVIKGGVVDNNEWWKKSHRESDSGESSVNSGSIKSSGSSSSSSRCNSRREKDGGGCWPFFIRRPKGHTKK